MDVIEYTLSDLFEQLGLADSEENIIQFIDRYRGVKQQAPLHEATFWTESQSKFLHLATSEGSEWNDVVQELNALL